MLSPFVSLTVLPAMAVHDSLSPWASLSEEDASQASYEQPRLRL
jgi:hypothetical protein